MASVNKVQVDGVVYDLSGGGGFSNNAKNALLDCLSHIAWVDENGQQYVDALQTALFADTWSVTNSLTNAVTSNPSATVAKDGSYSATISASVGYTLTGATVSVTMNGADITATAYNNGAISIPTVTGDVVITVVAVALTVVSISAVYTQSGTVYDTDSLDSLKADLVVIATFNDDSTSIVPSADYTLSGSLTVGTSTITVSYESKTTTFNVTVSDGFLYTPNRGLLSDQPYITKTTPTAQAQFTETIVDDALRLYCPQLSTATGRILYTFSPSRFSTYCKLTVEFKIADMSWVASTNSHNGWVKWQTGTSTGLETALGFSRLTNPTNPVQLRYFVGSTVNKQDISINEWHTLEIVNANDKQTITLDDVAVVTDANVASYTPSYGTDNCLVFDCGNTGANDIYFKRIELLCE